MRLQALITPVRPDPVLIVMRQEQNQQQHQGDINRQIGFVFFRNHIRCCGEDTGIFIVMGLSLVIRDKMQVDAVSVGSLPNRIMMMQMIVRGQKRNKQKHRNQQPAD